jgi:cysteine-rich repeat protein
MSLNFKCITYCNTRDSLSHLAIASRLRRLGRKIALVAAVALCITGVNAHVSQAQVLVFGDYSSSRTTLVGGLTSLGYTVTDSVTLPADLSPYDSIWHVSAFVELTAGEQVQLAAFLAANGGLHLTGERPCCETMNASIQTFLNGVVAGGGVAVGNQGDIGGPYAFNASALGSATSTPHVLTAWGANAPGGMGPLPDANVLATGAGGVAVGALWGPSDLVGGAGRVSILMDVNWFGSSGYLDVVENLQSFLTSPCGDGVIDAGEECDDGNTVDGDCCDSGCLFEPSESTCTDDGIACTNDVCDGLGNCHAPIDALCDDTNACTQDSCDAGLGCINDAIPVPSCKVAGKSILLLKNNSDDGKDKVIFKWLNGEETMLAELGDPLTTTDYTLCLYAGSSAATIGIPAGGEWKATGSKGFKFKDTAGIPDGAQKVILKSGATGKAKMMVKGKGDNLPDVLTPALDLPVTTQLINDENAACYEAVYDTLDIIKNDSKQFKAKKK